MARSAMMLIVVIAVGCGGNKNATSTGDGGMDGGGPGDSGAASDGGAQAMDAGWTGPSCGVDDRLSSACGPQGVGTPYCPIEFGTVLCADGHGYGTSCTSSNGVCTCHCTVDGVASGSTTCTTAVQYECGGPPDGSVPLDAGTCMLTPASCGFPVEVTTSTISCNCDADCPPFLPDCDVDKRCSATESSAHAMCPPDAGTPQDAGPPQCTTNGDCAVDEVCQGTTCNTVYCRTISGCPSGYGCTSGVCTR